MKKLFIPLALLFFASFFFVNCNKDDDEAIIEEVVVDPFDAERLNTGASNIELLTENTYTSLTIELAYVAGNRPTQSTLDSFMTFLNERIHKSGGINYVETIIPAPTQDSLTLDQLSDIEEQYRTQFRTENKIAVWCFNVNLRVIGESNSLGIAYNNTSLYLGKVPIQEVADENPVDYASVELNILKHEFGHLLGMVNLNNDDIHGAGEHENPEKGHCKIENCLMFFQPDVNSRQANLKLVEMLQRHSVLEFDPLCLADLRAMGGK